MMTSDVLMARSDRLAKLIETKLGVRGTGLEAKLRRAGRLLPRRVRQDAARLVAAQRVMGHPKLMMQQADPGALEQAFRRCESWLQSVDPGERRKDRILGFLGVNAVNLLVVGGAFIAYLVWADHL